MDLNHLSEHNQSIHSGSSDLLQVAEQAFASAGLGALSLIDLINAANILSKAGHDDITKDLYILWLACTDSPLAYAAQFNLAVIYENAGDDAAAEDAYQKVINKNPEFLNAHENLINLLYRVGRKNEVLVLWREVLKIVEQSPTDRLELHLRALNAISEIQLKKNSTAEADIEAEKMLLSSLRLEPAQLDILDRLHWLRRKQCQWPIHQTTSDIARNELLETSSPTAILLDTDDPQLHFYAAKKYAISTILTDVRPMTIKQSYGHPKLRIGYLANNFESFPLKIQTQHDLNQFEIFLFLTEKKNDLIVEKSVQFIQLDHLSDQDAAWLIRSKEIDILVDLQGLTPKARLNILSWRPAPVQIAWMGHPGTRAMPEIDYIIADPYVMPPILAPYFTEKPLLTSCGSQLKLRQTNKTKLLKRADLGLPKSSFIYCAFHDAEMINAGIFSCWLKILAQGSNSILWLCVENESARVNLKMEAIKQGIDPERIHFYETYEPSNFSSLYALADLFLDTYPFNDNENAINVLAFGLPVLTCVGRSYSSRTTGSLLSALELPDLICNNLREYEEKAVSLSIDHKKINKLRSQLNAKIVDGKSFENTQLVIELEKLYRQSLDVLPIAPIKLKATQLNLDYIRAPQSTNTRRYVIAAPPFEHNSAGIRVLYDLQKWLILAGLDAIVCTWFPGYPIEQFVDDIVIYPEVVPGNLFKAKRVIRYIMNVPGKLGYGEKQYDHNELLVAYSSELAHYANGMILQVPSIEPFFNKEGCIKMSDAFYVGKGKNLGLHPEECIEITKTFPPSRLEVAHLLRSVKTLYMYDDFSMLGIEAELCGCSVKLIRSDSAVVNYPRILYPSQEEFKRQLHEFIQITKLL